MKQEVIQDFLNLPGIAGVALMDGRSRPYFCGIDRTLNFQQKEALTQGILQVFETIPDEFDSFEFHFSGYQVYIYKFDCGIILLVLTHESLVYSDYLKTIKNLKATIREDITNAIAVFHMIASVTTLPGLITTRTLPKQQAKISSTDPNHKPPSTQTSTLTSQPRLPTIETPPLPATVKTVPASFTSPRSTTTEVSLIDAITALNQLSQFTTQYLGTYVIANYWKATRPTHDWLNQLQVDRSAQINLIHPSTQQLQAVLSPEQQSCLQEWVANFIQRCSQVIRDFPTLIQQKALTDAQKKLLLG
jgi:hypothetical protein